MTTFPIVLEQAHRQPRRKYGQQVVALSASDVMRRVLNIAIALTALVLLLPLVLIIAVAVKLSSPGPVFYTQTRIGLNRRRRLPPGSRYRDADRGGRPFTMFKFR